VIAVSSYIETVNEPNRAYAMHKYLLNERGKIFSSETIHIVFTVRQPR